MQQEMNADAHLFECQISAEFELGFANVTITLATSEGEQQPPEWFNNPEQDLEAITAQIQGFYQRQ